MNEIVTLEEAINISEKLRGEGKSVVICGGCFDILHEGHLTFLENSKKEGNALFVLLESDQNVRRLKGEGRPVNNQLKRAHNLSDLSFVNFVVLLPEITGDERYFKIIKKLKPNIITITKGDPQEGNKRKQVSNVGGRVAVVTGRLMYYSTTKLLDNS